MNNDPEMISGAPRESDFLAEDLVKLIENGTTLDQAKKLIEAGANLNSRRVNEKTPLLAACLSNNIEMAEFLLNEGADINLPGYYLGSTPIILAATHNNIELVSFLIDRGANIDTKDLYGFTALMHACENTHNHMAIMLIEKRANVNCANKAGVTPLILCCKSNNTYIASILLEKGADVNMHGHSDALVYACKSNNIETVKLLVEHRAKVDLYLLSELMSGYISWFMQIKDIPKKLVTNPNALEECEPLTINLNCEITPEIFDCLHFPPEFAGKVSVVNMLGQEMPLHFHDYYE
ncbi:MAG: ankyrin repeat domain-containing protein [Rickettsiaceae bacterium]|nr:ankyrin repeat domain-containing protein [Rickettsiaceae bacterium]